MRSKREDADPRDRIGIGGTGQRGRDMPSFFQDPVGGIAEPVQRRPPIEVAMNVGFKENQISDLLLI
jgi:hypothetical protein